MTRIVSRKRARSSDTATTSTAPPEDVPASASWAIQNPALQLPTELIYTILAISVGDYVGGLMLHPSRIYQQDVILTFLHASRLFRVPSGAAPSSYFPTSGVTHSSSRGRGTST
ncbi:hypothetical protein BC826DRAFT_1072492 [Russula brevipes]|nr:hypothetical protein BC826DRAFT_1072492 [Russula brevipes]